MCHLPSFLPLVVLPSAEGSFLFLFVRLLHILESVFAQFEDHIFYKLLVLLKPNLLLNLMEYFEFQQNLYFRLHKVRGKFAANVMHSYHCARFRLDVRFKLFSSKHFLITFRAKAEPHSETGVWYLRTRKVKLKGFYCFDPKLQTARF